ncbi:MAG: nitroreductase family deazaflavin-dependent oxidoreductase [Gammaproteobacteria bacterium]|nr:nitroreductase family deazaflavin-dependent oxidoreductase [Gammaproteobacteria bacterium]
MRLVKPLLRWFTQLNVQIYKWSGGRVFNRIGGGNICIVKMTGAKSGTVREFPLIHVPYEDGVILVASFAGGPKNPVWYNNLIVHPDIEVTVRDHRVTLKARLASAAEKAKLWPLCCQHYRDFDLYQRRSPRDIPIFICQPTSAGQSVAI